MRARCEHEHGYRFRFRFRYRYRYRFRFRDMWRHYTKVQSTHTHSAAIPLDLDAPNTRRQHTTHNTRQTRFPASFQMRVPKYIYTIELYYTVQLSADPFPYILTNQKLFCFCCAPTMDTKEICGSAYIYILISNAGPRSNRIMSQNCCKLVELCPQRRSCGIVTKNKRKFSKNLNFLFKKRHQIIHFSNISLCGP